jgi:hypothetical protein
MVSSSAGEYLREFSTEERYRRTSTGLLTRPGRRAVLDRNGPP